MRFGSSSYLGDLRDEPFIAGREFLKFIEIDQDSITSVDDGNEPWF